MTLKGSLLKKAEEVFDLRERGLLTRIHKDVWVDVLDIVERFRDVEPINVYAHLNKCQVRFWTQNGTSWNVAIRPQLKGFDAQILTGATYEETEHKARQYIEKHNKFWRAKC